MGPSTDRCGHGLRQWVLVHINGDLAGRALVATVDHGEVNDDIAVLAGRRRVHAAIVGRWPDHIGDRAAGGEVGKIYGDRLLVAGGQECILCARRRLGARSNSDTQGGRIGQLAVTQRVGNHSRSNSTGVCVEGDRAATDRRTAEAGVGAANDGHRELIAIGVAVVEEDRRDDRSTSFEISSVVIGHRWTVERLQNRQYDLRRSGEST